MFFQMTTEKRTEIVNLAHRFAGPVVSSCWLIGGGPSLSSLPVEEIVRTPTAKMGVNLAGTQLIRPTFWTAYDPSSRFHRSVYLDPSIMKFVARRRGMDLVPESTFKVCESPNLYLFDGDDQRGFANFVHPSHQKIVDWQDSFVQAIDILYQLGFRRIYLAGCEMQVHPSEDLIAAAQTLGVSYDRRGTLKTFVEACKSAGMTMAQLDEMETPRQYHFDEQKPLMSAVQTDQHYFRVVQFLRLSRRAMSLAGLELISVTPGSRLNDHFDYRDVHQVCRELRDVIGDPEGETTRGRYTQVGRRGETGLCEMRDVLPPKWKGEEVEVLATPGRALAQPVAPGGERLERRER